MPDLQRARLEALYRRRLELARLLGLLALSLSGDRCRATPSGEALLLMGGTSAVAFRFRSMLSGLGLPLLPLTPGSFRAGSATALFVSRVEIFELFGIMIRGRWRRAFATLDRYLH